MSKTIKLAGFVAMAALAGIISCSDEENSGKPELSPAVQQYLSMKFGASNAMSKDMAGPINNSFQGFFANSGMTNGRLAGDSTGEVPPDSTIIEEPWQSCAIITEIDNEDGSHTSINDYGDGCEEGWEGYKYFIHGKMSSTYRNQYSKVGSVYHDSYYYASEYDNYGGNYNGEWEWLINGGGVYQGESEYDTVAQTFTGAYSYSDENTYTYDSTTYYYKGLGTTRYDQNKYVVESSEYEYSTGDAYYYKSKVLSPLVMDYSCYSSMSPNLYMFFTYVSGRERIQYKDGEVEGSFEIDYGDGECDNIITIYENGKVTVVDLSTLWNSYGKENGVLSVSGG